MITKQQAMQMADARIKVVMSYDMDFRHYALNFALKGGKPYYLELAPNAGHNYQCIFEAIYRYYQKNPDSGIDKLLYDALFFEAGLCGSAQSVNKSLNLFATQLENQKNGLSPFAVDMASILEKLRNNIISHNFMEQPDYKAVVMDYDNYFMSHFGLGILNGPKSTAKES